MERRINNKINTFQKKFKDDIVGLIDTEFKKLKENELNGGDELNGGKLNEIIKFIYDYPYMELTPEDFIKRKRIKNSVPLYERCMALKSNGKQCTRRKKGNCKFCGTHIKGTLNGVVNDTENDTKQKQKKLEITTTEIQGIQYFIDADENVYNTYDVHQNKNNPKIIAKYIIDEQGNYKIPSIFDKK